MTESYTEPAPDLTYTAILDAIESFKRAGIEIEELRVDGLGKKQLVNHTQVTAVADDGESVPSEKDYIGSIAHIDVTVYPSIFGTTHAALVGTQRGRIEIGDGGRTIGVDESGGQDK